MEAQAPLNRHYYYNQIRDWLNAHRDFGYPEVYSALSSDEDRIRLTMALLAENGFLNDDRGGEKTSSFEKHEGLSQTLGSAAEDLMMSQKKLRKGNVLLELCTKAIAYAPIGSKELALGYGRRAEALLRLKLYEDCVRDVERALQLAYPPELRAKLCLVKTKAQAIIHPHDSVVVLKSAEETREYLKFLDSRKKGNITTALNKIVRGKMGQCPGPLVKWKDKCHLPRVTGPKNEELRGASDAIAIRYSTKYGRHLVATRDIQVGEILAVQKPYAAVLELNRTYTNCWYCLNQIWSGVPCNHCADVTFCSETCRDRAWQEFHDFECPLVGLMIVDKFDLTAFMSVRLLIKAYKEAGGWAELKEKTEKIALHSDARTKGFTSNILDATKYASIYTLSKCTEERTMEDLFRLSVGATKFAYLFATMTDIFGEKMEGERDILLNHPWVVFAGTILLQHTQIHSINSQMLCEWDPKEKESWVRAMALVPLYGFINHSCNPSVNYTSYGNYMGLYAISPIKKGEQIFDHRGMTFVDTPLEQRQLHKRENFFFTCDCPPCTQNWPQFANLTPYTEMNLPYSIKKRVETIMSAHNMLSIMKRHSRIDTIADIPSSITRIFQQLNALYEIVKEPCREIEEIKRTLHVFQRQSGSRCQSLEV